MKLFLAPAVISAVSAWEQPLWSDVQASLNNADGRSVELDWGHPIDDDSRKWYHCPTLTKPANAEAIVCKKSTCALKCNGGFLAVGRRRVKCKYSKKLGTYRWKKELGTCQGCDPSVPAPNDSNVAVSCYTNGKTNRKVCNMVCPSGQTISHTDVFLKPKQGTRINCKCPRSNNRECGWYKKRTPVDHTGFSCAGSATTTTTTTLSTTTNSTVESEFDTLTDVIDTSLTHCTNTDNFPARIVNGVTATAGDWPFIVRLSIGGSFRCGGSLIHDEWVVTAAHCCELVMSGGDAEGATTQVFINDHSDTVSETNEIIIEVPANKMKNHPQYGTTGKQNFDVCVIGLGDMSSHTANMPAKACLATSNPTHGQACWVAGWGLTAPASSGGSTANELQSVGVNIFGPQYCIENTVYTSQEGDDICAGIPDNDGNGEADGGKDSCQGDSGGPLICPQDGKAALVAVVSRGGQLDEFGNVIKDCADADTAGIYTSVVTTRDFIDSTVAAGYDALSN